MNENSSAEKLKDDSEIKGASARLCNVIKLVKTLKNSDEKKKICKIINNFYEKEKEDYFNLNNKNKIIIGKISHGPKYDKNRNLIPYSFVGPTDLFPSVLRSPNQLSKQITKKITKSINTNESNQKSLKHSTISELKKLQNQSHNYYKIIDDKNLINYYKNIGKRIKSESNIDGIDVPELIKKSLSEQQKFLKTYENINKKEYKLNKKLRKKCHKNSSDLLSVKSNHYQYKAQEALYHDTGVRTMRDFCQKEKLWKITLRNPLSQKGNYELKGYANSGQYINNLFAIFNINKDKKYFHNHKYCLSQENIIKKKRKNCNKIFK